MPFIRPSRRPGVRNTLMLTLFAAATGLGSTAWAADPQVAHPLVGRWKVASINGAPPPKFLAGQVLVIQADAQVANLDLSASGDASVSESTVQKALKEALKDALMRGTWRADEGR